MVSAVSPVPPILETLQVTSAVAGGTVRVNLRSPHRSRQDVHSAERHALQKHYDHYVFLFDKITMAQCITVILIMTPIMYFVGIYIMEKNRREYTT